ncbi:hypothetical protein NPIL_106881 [Nephila pilipes]|uniref:RING-type domain-containing protein n=1 Tax=Nephila pilipes TaxID=299642 RepID=A0A8X6N4I2_NEPPI|nr:hypothetical protein NPIL_106881 [Nephila pilipes]
MITPSCTYWPTFSEKPTDATLSPESQIVLDSIYGGKWLNTVFETLHNCSICLQAIQWAEKMACGHFFHLQCLMRNMNICNTCLLVRFPNPLQFEF